MNKKKIKNLFCITICNIKLHKIFKCNLIEKDVILKLRNG